MLRILFLQEILSYLPLTHDAERIHPGTPRRSCRSVSLRVTCSIRFTLGASTCVNLNREMEINSPLILYAAVLILLKVIFFLRWYIITLLLMK